MIEVQDIYNVTDDGLDIIVSYFPDAKECAGTTKKFKYHEERTPSASIKKINNIWKVTDFGGEGRAIGPIDIVMEKERVGFAEAIILLADKYNVQGKGLSRDVYRPKIRKYQTPAGKTPGFEFEYNKNFSDYELKVWGPNVKQEHLEKYGWKSVKSYTKHKDDGQSTTIESTDTYPIFVRDCVDFRKIYQPLNPDKAYRFFYDGKKPANFINGLLELQHAYEKMNDTLEREFRADPKNEDKTFYATKIPEAIMCSGERDAMCVAALGFYPIWLNSETYNLSEKEFANITRLANEVYDIPDIDDTGIKKGKERAFKFLDLKTIWLPSWLSNYKDIRGNKRKDFRDYVELRPLKYDFKNLMTLAMPMRFWDITKDDKGRKKYEINTEHLYYFLRMSGFVAISDNSSKSGRTLAKIDGFSITEISTSNIFDYLRQFAIERFLPIELRNLINNSTRINDSSLSKLVLFEPDFTDHTFNSQRFYFNNSIIEVSGSSISKCSSGQAFVWDGEIVPHDINLLEEFFSIKCNKDGDFDIEIKQSECKFLNYLINTSRCHWRKELEDGLKTMSDHDREEYRLQNKFNIAGPILDASQIQEQKQHLINKIFAIGYLLHRYKSESRAWCVFAMDAKIGSESESNGGSGKSFFFKALRTLIPTVNLPGKNKRLLDNPHIYERVSEHTDMILVDDVDEFMDLTFFFDAITGEITVNPKNARSFEIPFEKAPKFAFTSNFGLRKSDPSIERRVLYTVFSDYYHQKTGDNDYHETRTIFDDFGINLLRDYDENDWNLDLNFFMQCCKFYLKYAGESIKIQPPMQAVSTRNAMAAIKEIFLDWADAYFGEDSGNIDRLIPRAEAFNDFTSKQKVKGWTMQTFTKSLKAYCKFSPHIIELNPASLKNSSGRIIRKNEEGVACEMIYVKSRNCIDDKAFSNNETEKNKPL